LEFGTSAGDQKMRMMGPKRSLTINSTWQTDGQTDWQMDTGRQQRPRLRVAFRG